jgi:hypothetical protein
MPRRPAVVNEIIGREVPCTLLDAEGIQRRDGRPAAKLIRFRSVVVASRAA